MPAKCCNIRPLLRNEVARAISTIIFLIALAFSRGVSAGQFDELAHADRAFIGFVEAAKLGPISTYPGAQTRGSENNVERHRYVIASVAPEKFLIGRPPVGEEKQVLSICHDQNIAVGSYYLFLMDKVPLQLGECMLAEAFLLGAGPGGKPNSSIVLTADTLLLLPPSPVLDRHQYVMPDAHMLSKQCDDNAVVVETYLDLDRFIDLMRQEKARIKRGE